MFELNIYKKDKKKNHILRQVNMNMLYYRITMPRKSEDLFSCHSDRTENYGNLNTIII